MEAGKHSRTLAIRQRERGRGRDRQAQRLDQLLHIKRAEEKHPINGLSVYTDTTIPALTPALDSRFFESSKHIDLGLTNDRINRVLSGRHLRVVREAFRWSVQTANQVRGHHPSHRQHHPRPLRPACR